MKNRVKNKDIFVVLVILLTFVALLLIIIFLSGEKHKNTKLKTEISHLERNSTDRELTIFLLSKGKILPSFYLPPGLQRIIYRKLLLINIAGTTGDREKVLLTIADDRDFECDEEGYFFKLNQFYSLRLNYWCEYTEKSISLVKNREPIKKTFRPLYEREGEILIVHPGEVFREDFFLASWPQKSVKQWAKVMKIDPEKLENFLQEKGGIDEDLIYGLTVACFNSGLSFWFSLTAHYFSSLQAISNEQELTQFEREFQETQKKWEKSDTDSESRSRKK